MGVIKKLNFKLHRLLRVRFYGKIINTFYKDCMSILDAGCGRGDFLMVANSKESL